MALQETRQKRSQVSQVDSNVFYSSGYNQERLETGFLLSKIINNNCKNVFLNIKDKYQKINLLNVHFPTKEKNVIKNKVYEETDRRYNKILKYSIKIMIDDFIAKIKKKLNIQTNKKPSQQIEQKQ